MKKQFRILLAAAAIVASSSGVCAEVYGNLNPPGVYFGTGNPNGNFNIDRENGLELGLRAKNRSSIGPVLINGSSGVYSVAQGACGTSCGTGTKAKWNYEFSMHTTDGSLLSDYLFRLGVDQDASAGTSFAYVEPLGKWSDEQYDGLFGAQNSQNVAFGDTPGGAFNLTTAGLYDFVLLAYAKNDTAFSNALAKVDMTVRVPEPGTVALFGLGLVSLAALRRRKAKQA